MQEINLLPTDLQRKAQEINSLNNIDAKGFIQKVQNVFQDFPIRAPRNNGALVIGI